MSTRMDRYNLDKTVGSRTSRNQQLYEDVKNSTITNYDVNSNISVIAEDASKMSVSRVKKMLDERYNDETPKRISIEIPEYNDVEEEKSDTKEYDINVILEKARQGKNVDYSKERLKKVRETQYDILSNLNLDTKPKLEVERTKEEENLIDLINTITQIEIQNKNERKKDEDTDRALDLLSDLKEEVSDEEKEIQKQEEIKEILEEKKEEAVKQVEKEIKEEIKVDIKKDKVSENTETYEDFKDISKGDKISIIIKIVTFFVVVGLVIAALIILNNILDLNLF